MVSYSDASQMNLFSSFLLLVLLTGVRPSQSQMTMSSSLRSRLYASASNVNMSTLNTQFPRDRTPNQVSRSQSAPGLSTSLTSSTSAADRVVLNLKVVMHGPRPEMRVLIRKQGATLSQKLSAFVPATSRENGSNTSSSLLTLEIPRSVPAEFRRPLLALLRENVALNVAFVTHSKLTTRDALGELCSLLCVDGGGGRSAGVNTALLLMSDIDFREQNEMTLRYFLRLTSEALRLPTFTAIYDNVALNAVGITLICSTFCGSIYCIYIYIYISIYKLITNH